MSENSTSREYWLSVLEQIARPVLENLSAKRLKKVMPVIAENEKSAAYAHQEAFMRMLAGLAPWLELEQTEGKEKVLQQEFRELARQCINAATDPDSPDYMVFGNEISEHAVVDTAYLAHSILRAPAELWEKLDGNTKHNVIRALKATRACKSKFNNHILFSAIVEAAIFRIGEEWDWMRVDYVLHQHEQWYLKDGMYGDGPQFHWDYYNSFVIQPMLLDIIQAFKEISKWSNFREPIIERAQRYAAIQERLISPEGAFPPVGRSLVYRFGAFQHLAQMALQHKLPKSLSPAQVRCALTAVMKRMLSSSKTFDENGWLTIGFCGHQPSLGEWYITNGSVYLCTNALLPLGLPAEDEFWSGEDEPWTSQKLWDGVDMPPDHALRR